ncbi:MAG: HAD family hydrolase [Clostridia bacterium]|nr:HAD family hydrolase [Clostridia bacterium]
MYKLIVFDLDGTLLDTLDDLTSAVNAGLSACALPCRTREEVRSFVGNGIVHLMRLAVGDAKDKADEALQVFRAYYAEHCKDKTRAYDGIYDMLDSLKKLPVKTAVLSNKADFAVRALVEEYFPNAFFLSQGENESAGIRKKPAPDALFAIMEQASVGQAETLYVGDSEVDILTAKNAGVDCVSVTWGFKDETFLIENGATKMARTPQEVLQFI